MGAVALVLAPSRKHAEPFLGRPLVLWIVEAVVCSGAVEKIFVVTGEAEVRTAVITSGLPGVELIDDALDLGSTAPFEGNPLVVLGSMSPLIRSEDVRGILDRLVETGADSVVSVVRPKGSLWKPNGPWAQPSDDAVLIENGAITVLGSSRPSTGGLRPSGRVAYYEMAEAMMLDPENHDGWRAAEALVGVCRQEEFLANQGERLRGIRLLLSDVDGVLTDAGMYYGEGGDELKRFNTRDGKGFEIVRELGLKTGIVTSEDTAIVARRAAKLRLDYLHQGIQRKDVSLNEICRDFGIAPSQVAYVGDDVNDLPILTKVGFAACPADAMDLVKRCVHYVCRAKGGEGAVREVCDLIAGAHRQAEARLPKDR